MSTEQSLILRVNALLDRPHAFLIYGGGEGGEFMAQRICQYSGRHRSIIPATTSQEDQLVNRTQLSYPGIYAYLTLPNETYHMTSRDEFIQGLRDREWLTDDRVTASEDFANGSELPLIRIHKVNYNLFGHAHSWYLNTPRLYKEYAHALTDVKLRINREQIYTWKEWYFKTWVPGLTEQSFTPFWSWEEINQHLDSWGEDSIESMRLKILVLGLGPRPASIDQFLTTPMVDLHYTYRQWLYPSFQGFQKNLAEVVKSSPQPRVLLDYRRIIEEPRYLADQFDIANWAEFYEGVAQWHTANLDLLLAHGFTEFEPLRLS